MKSRLAAAIGLVGGMLLANIASFLGRTVPAGPAETISAAMIGAMLGLAMAMLLHATRKDKSPKNDTTGDDGQE